MEQNFCTICTKEVSPYCYAKLKLVDEIPKLILYRTNRTHSNVEVISCTAYDGISDLKSAMDDFNKLQGKLVTD